jgi:hypothetical protein
MRHDEHRHLPGPRDRLVVGDREHPLTAPAPFDLTVTPDAHRPGMALAGFLARTVEDLTATWSTVIVLERVRARR